ncbi:putative F-box protein [Cocos nucifera]|nr:putative F-box protein [Cocos nucifera]
MDPAAGDETRVRPRTRSSSSNSFLSDWVVVDGSDDAPSSDQESIVYDDSDEEEMEVDQDRDLDRYFDEMLVPMSSLKEEMSLRVLYRVLPYLPAKALLRLRCVSRKWNACISSQFFIISHSLHPHPISGFFLHRPTADELPAYAPFDCAADALPDPSLSFLPEPVAVAASARGVLCCHGRASGGYYVCNPTTSTWAALPPPANDHGADPAIALVFDEPGVYNFHADYRVVCAHPIAGGGCDGIYGFETFSSAAWKWAASAEICPAERILAGSGVAACGMAYWRTTTEEVVAFDPVAYTWTAITRPGADLDLIGWELGEMEGRLSCTCVKEGSVTAWVMGNGGWEKAGEWYRVWSGIGEEWPLRSQGRRELLFWEAEDKGVVARNLKGRVTRVLRDHATDHHTDFVPYVSTLVQVRRYDSFFSASYFGF